MTPRMNAVVVQIIPAPHARLTGSVGYHHVRLEPKSSEGAARLVGVARRRRAGAVAALLLGVAAGWRRRVEQGIQGVVQTNANASLKAVPHGPNDPALRRRVRSVLAVHQATLNALAPHRRAPPEIVTVRRYERALVRRGLTQLLAVEHVRRNAVATQDRSSRGWR